MLLQLLMHFEEERERERVLRPASWMPGTTLKEYYHVCLHAAKA